MPVRVFLFAATLLFASISSAQDISTKTAMLPKDTVMIATSLGNLAFELVVANTIYRDGRSLETFLSTGEIAVGVTSATSSPVPSVEYRIFSDTAEFDTGVQVLTNVPSGAYYRPSKNWTIKSGTHTFTALLDPNQKLNESSTQRLNNTATMTITITAWDRRQLRPADFADAVPELLFRRALTGTAGTCEGALLTTSDNPYMEISLRYTGPTQPPADWEPCRLVSNLFAFASIGNGWIIDTVSITDATSYYHDYTVTPTTPTRASGSSAHSVIDAHFTAPNRVQQRWRVITNIKGPRGTQPSFHWNNPLKLR